MRSTAPGSRCTRRCGPGAHPLDVGLAVDLAILPRTDGRLEHLRGVRTRRVTVGNSQGPADEFGEADAGAVRLLFQSDVLGIGEGNLGSMAHDGSVHHAGSGLPSALLLPTSKSRADCADCPVTGVHYTTVDENLNRWGGVGRCHIPQ